MLIVSESQMGAPFIVHLDDKLLLMSFRGYQVSDRLPPGLLHELIKDGVEIDG